MAATPRRQNRANGGGGTTYDTVATLADLQSLRREIHEELSGLRADIATFQKEITYQFSRRSETNWSTVLTAISVILIISGMAATLVWSLIQSEANARLAAVQTIVDKQIEVTGRIDQNIAENRETIRDMDTVMQREMRLLDEVLQREMGLHVKRIDELIDENRLDIQRNEDAIEKLDERGTHASAIRFQREGIR